MFGADTPFVYGVAMSLSRFDPTGRPVLILMGTTYKCQLESLQVNLEVRTSFPVNLGTSVASAYQIVVVSED